MNVKGSNPAKKFYFLDYFYIILKAIDDLPALDSSLLLKRFIEMKERLQLGESKYKKLTIDETELHSPKQLIRIGYTFKQILMESLEYNIVQQNNDSFILTSNGKDLLGLHEKNGSDAFNLSIMSLMEKNYNAFRYLVNFLYSANSIDGSLIFPHYSPRLLDMPKETLKTMSDVERYTKKLAKKIEDDVREFSKKEIILDNQKLLDELYASNLLIPESGAFFDSKNYNATIRHCKDFWESYLLKNVYNYDFSWSAFEIWSYRAKQLGILHVTEFYPGYSGKVIFPLSVCSTIDKASDFQSIFCYADGKKMYIHSPLIANGENLEVFVNYLVDAYFKIKRTAKTYFINLMAIRELVCYSMKISEKIFAAFIDAVYRLNLQGKLKIKIALEVDKLPEETKAMYLTREPVMVAGKYRNIIAIDISKEHKS